MQTGLECAGQKGNGQEACKHNSCFSVSPHKKLQSLFPFPCPQLKSLSGVFTFHALSKRKEVHLISELSRNSNTVSFNFVCHDHLHIAVQFFFETEISKMLRGLLEYAVILRVLKLDQDPLHHKFLECRSCKRSKLQTCKLPGSKLLNAFCVHPFKKTFCPILNEASLVFQDRRLRHIRPFFFEF